MSKSHRAAASATRGRPFGGHVNMSMKYKIIRSARRKRIALQITGEGLEVRAPYSATERQITELIQNNLEWIEKNMARMKEKMQNEPPAEKLTMDELRALADEALKVIPERVAFYASVIGVTYGRITIRNQRSRWGSCSSRGNLNFNCLLMLMPPEVIDSVVVHELCHRKEPNHSERFYAEVLKAYPEYWKWHGWLKENGERIMRRMTG